MVCGARCPLAGIVKFVAHLLGREIEEIGLVIGNYSASAALFLPVSVLIGGAIFLVGWLFWKLTIAIIRAMSQGMKRLARE